MYTPKPLDKYKHFKGNCYQIMCVAEDSEDGHKEVVYQALYAPYKIYTRDMEMFLSKVDKEKYPDATQEYRFELLDEEGFIVSREHISTMKNAMDEAIEAITIEDALVEEKEAPAQEEEATTPTQPKAENMQINPILMRFLDAETIDEKIEIITDEKENLTDSILTPMELSIGMEREDGSPMDRYRSMKNFLLLKQKYERQHR